MLIVILLTDAHNSAATNRRRLVALIGVESVTCIIALSISLLYSA